MSLIDYPFDGATLLQKKRSLRRELLQRSGLINKKVAILSGSTIGEIKNMLELFLLNEGIKPEFYIGGYGLFYENLVFDDGSLAAFKPDFLYIHTSRKNLQQLPVPSDSEADVAAKLDAEWARFEAAFEAAKKFGCPVIVNSFDPPTHRLMGNRDAVDARGSVHFINEMNARIATYVAKNDGFYLNDLAYLAARFGLDNWFSESEWYLYKYAVSMQYIPELCHNISLIIKSLLGKNKKGLVLDLDNTLWGGVIGEVGAQGVELSTETPGGMAYSEFQQYLRQLEDLGILLNVASKNEESIALTGFERSDSPLKRKDFLCFKANWEPKSQNIAKIAQEINILPESLVFVDDNPAEREIVRQQLPAVTIANFSAPEEMIASLDRAGYFEVTALSADDAKRNEMYRQNLQRAAAQQSFGSYDDYLRSLEMTAELGSFDPPHAERITQLINKTNQFNLTTRRYTAQEVESLIGNPDAVTLYGRLEDKFGDNGLVSAMIGSISGDTCTVDLWIMSCRVFKRNLEQTMMDEFVRRCAGRGVKKVVGHYLPTAKNLLVKEIYGTMGFEKTSEDENSSTFVLNVADYRPQNDILTVVVNE